jgi:type I restriction enzyme S subunit
MDGKVACETKEHTNEAGIANSSARLLPKDTVVLSRTASVGFVTRMGREMATSQDFVNWVCGPEVDPRFLALLLQASRGYIRSLASGAIHQTVYMPTLEAFTVCIPEINEQKRIAAKVEEQMAAVERARAAAESQLEAASQLMSAALMDAFSHSHMSRWSRALLGACGEIVSGVTLGRPLKGTDTRRVPYLRVANVKDGHLDLSDVYETEATEVELDRLRLQHGDLLLTEGGDPDKLGRGCTWQEQLAECIHQNHIFRVRLRQAEFLPDFVSAQIASSYGKAYFLAHAKRTTGIATINRRVLAGFPLMAPSLREQQAVTARIADHSAKMERVRTAAEAQLAAINALPAALLRQTFSGAL